MSNLKKNAMPVANFPNCENDFISCRGDSQRELGLLLRQKMVLVPGYPQRRRGPKPLPPYFFVLNWSKNIVIAESTTVLMAVANASTAWLCSSVQPPMSSGAINNRTIAPNERGIRRLIDFMPFLVSAPTKIINPRGLRSVARTIPLGNLRDRMLDRCFQMLKRGY